MPYYEKNKPKKLKAEVDVNQTKFDDLIILSGDTGSYIGLIPLAENLPNLTIGGGRRNVYQHQLRERQLVQKRKK